MRVTVLPREYAATVTARAVLRAGWAVAAAFLILAAIAVIDLAVDHGHSHTALFPLGTVLVMLCALTLLARRPAIITGVLYLAVGAITVFLYQYLMLVSDPTLAASGIYLLNRPAIALVLVGPVGNRLIHGVLWCGAGYLLGLGGTAAAQLMTGHAVQPGWGATIVLCFYVILIVALDQIRRRQRSRVPDFSVIEAETRWLTTRRQLEERAAAIIHDTILSDLTAISIGDGTVDFRARARIARDLHAMTAAAVIGRDGTAIDGDAQSDLRARLLAVIRNAQWRGLGVSVTGGDAITATLSPGAIDAVVGALGSCLDNVLQHADGSAAEVFFDTNGGEFSIMVADRGPGFDPAAIGPDRLGIRTAITSRVQNCGGTVRVWSAEGAGTSIIITVPQERQNA